MTGHHVRNKAIASVAEALAPLADGMTILVGGFGQQPGVDDAEMIRGTVGGLQRQPIDKVQMQRCGQYNHKNRSLPDGQCRQRPDHMFWRYRKTNGYHYGHFI